MNVRTAPASHSADTDSDPGIDVDWSATLRLAIVASALAAFAAVLFAGRVSEQTIVLAVIVVASIASWAQPDRQATGRHWR